ncbi:hypothetical protein ACF0H5_004299 [Mactra antiquata]
MESPNNGQDSPDSGNPMLETEQDDREDNNGTTILISKPEEYDTEVLFHTKIEKINMKDFGAEVRAYRDVDNFLDRTLLILDMEQTSLQDILETMLKKILENKDNENFSVEEAIDATYCHQQAQILSKSISGTIKHGMDYDQSWACILCEIPILNRRHVVISRLANPVNLGPTQQDVQYIILVAASTKEVGSTNIKMG